jgi:hypothetical protein
MGGDPLPTALVTQSYCGQTFEVCHHQNNDTVRKVTFTASHSRFEWNH